MFQFRTEHIINSLAFNGVPGARVVQVTNATDPSIPAGETAVDIKQVGRFPQFDSVSKNRTTEVYKVSPSDPVNEVLTFDLSTLTLADLVGSVLRLDLSIELQGADIAEYSRWAIIKGQPLYAEYWVGTLPASTAALATALAAEWDKVLAKDGRKLVTVTASGTNVVVTATNEYQRLSGEVVQIQHGTSTDPLIMVTGAVTTAGAQGVGTAWFITKNLRIPTLENTRFGAPNSDERPIEGSRYIQYTFVLEGEANFHGQSAVGQKVVSRTRHIIYLLESLETPFEALIDDIIDGGVPIDPRA